MKRITYAPLTAEETAALRSYAAEHGRPWKRDLRTEWMRASALPVLHRLRNTHGPSWLDGYRLPGPAVNR